MSDRVWERVLVLIILVGLIAAGIAAYHRYQVEESNQTVELVLDYPDALRLAQREEISPRELLERFRAAGVTTLAVGEYNLTDYLQGGNVLAYQGSDLISQVVLSGQLREPFATLLNSGRVNPRATYIIGNNPATFPAFSADLRSRLGGQGIRVLSIAGRPVLEVSRSLPTLSSVNVGLAPDQLAMARRVGLYVAPRFGNFEDATPSKIEAQVAKAPKGPSTVAIFTGVAVLGYPAWIGATAEALDRQGLVFGLVEFSDQEGEAQLARALSYRIVRVHSITPGEMAKIKPEVAVARVQRAVRERSIRVLYLRPFLNPAVLERADGPATDIRGKTLAFNLKYVELLKKELNDYGFRLGRARPLRPLESPLPGFLMMALGVTAGGLLLLRRFVHLGLPVEAALLAASVLVTAVLALKGWALLARQLWALGASVIFPALGVLLARDLVERWRTTPGTGTPVRPVRAGWRSLVGAGVASAVATVVTLPGALFVVGTLAETRFQVKVAQFAGVKVTYTLPLLLVWLAIELAAARRRQGREVVPSSLNEFWRDLREVLARPVTWEHAALVAVVGLAGLFYLLRSGTYTGVPVPGFERLFRDYLEQVLVIRPRTKEFLLGHPALFLALLVNLRSLNWPVWALYLAGTIGQMSIVNTFSHIHTPLMVSVVRTGLGLLLGLLVGLVVAALLDAARSARSLFGKKAETP